LLGAGLCVKMLLALIIF